MAPTVPLWVYVGVAAIGALASYLLTPAARVFAIKVGAIKVPGRDRDVHPAPTPTLGGLAMYPAFVLALFSGALFTPLRSTFRFTGVYGIVVGGLVALAVGVADDRRELPAHVKTAGDVVAAGILFQSSVKMDFFWLPRPIGVLSLSPELSAIVTIFWVVLLVNAVNFVDGLDGLAAGLTAIAAGAFLLYVRQLQSQIPLAQVAPLAAAALVGTCLGFLRHNFHPARIIMGDAGARLLGFLIAAATISVMETPVASEVQGGRLALPLVFTPVVFLAVPITDTVFAFVRRTARGQAFYHADKEHIHHRLLRLGHSQRQAVLVMYGWAVLLGGGLVVAGKLPWGRFLLLFAVAVGTVALLTIAPRLRQPDGPPSEPELRTV